MDLSLHQLRRELAAPLAHPDAAELKSLGGQVLAWLTEHFATLPDQSIGRTSSRREMQAMLGEPAPEHGRDFGEVLNEFSEKIAPFAFRVNHPRFFAFIPSAPNYISVLADLLCAGANFFAGVWLEAAGPTQVELVVLEWFKELLDYPAEAGGILTGSHLFGASPPPVMEGSKWEPLIAHNVGPAGSVVMFNNQVWHHGGLNTSSRVRYVTQVTYARRIVGHKFYTGDAGPMNYVMPEHVYRDASPRLKRLLGFLPHGAYG